MIDNANILNLFDSSPLSGGLVVRLRFGDYLSYSVMVEFYFGVGLFVEPCVGVYGVVWMFVG